MGLGLYDAAFCALGRIYGHDARGAITGSKLIGGFVSSAAWPVAETPGGRGTYEAMYPQPACLADGAYPSHLSPSG